MPDIEVDGSATRAGNPDSVGEANGDGVQLGNASIEAFLATNPFHQTSVVKLLIPRESEFLDARFITMTLTRAIPR